MKKLAVAIGGLLVMVALVGFVSALNPLSNKDWEYDPDNDGLNNLEEF